MRDPDRIDRILMLIGRIWKDMPDLRLGQLLANASPEFERLTYNVEDKVLEAKLVDFMRRMESCRN